MFSKFDEGIQVSNAFWEKLPYEKVVRHFAKSLAKVHGLKTVVDASCGIGGISLPFAKYFQVIGMDESSENLKITKKHAGIYQVQHSISLCRGSLHNRPEGVYGDLVIVNLELDDKLTENFIELVQLGLLCARSALLILPHSVDPDALADGIYSLEGIEPYVDFYLMFGEAHMLFTCCIIGPLALVNMESAGKMIRSKLSMKKTQSRYLEQILSQVSLTVFMGIYNKIEQEGDEAYQGKTRLLVKEALKIPGVTIDDVPLLRAGKRSSVIETILKYSGEYYNKEASEETGLTMDGVEMTSVLSISRYLCQRFGLYPKNTYDTYLVESTISLIFDMQRDLEETCPEELNAKLATRFNALLGRMGVSFSKEKLTLADFFLISFLEEIPETVKLPDQFDIYRNTINLRARQV